MNNPLYDADREKELIEIIETISQAIEDNEDNPNDYYVRALQYYQLSQQYYDIFEDFGLFGDKDLYYKYVNNAYKDIEKALSFDIPLDLYAYHFKLFMLKKLKKWEELIDYGMELRKKELITLKDNILIGEAFFNLGEWQKCIDFYTASISEAGDEEISHYKTVFIERGIAYSELDEYELALNDYKKHIKYEKITKFDKYNVYGLMASAYVKLNDYKEAISAYSNAIEIYTENADMYFKRGSIYCDCLHEYSNAVKDFEEAINLNDENRFYYSFCAYAYVHKGNIEEETDKALALQDYEKAIEYYKIAHKLEYGDEDSKKAEFAYSSTVGFAISCKENLLKEKEVDLQKPVQSEKINVVEEESSVPILKYPQSNQLRDLWTSLLKNIPSSPTASLLNLHTVPIEINENNIKIGCKPNFYNMLNSETKRKSIEEGAKTLFGKSVNLEIKAVDINEIKISNIEYVSKFGTQLQKCKNLLESGFFSNDLVNELIKNNVFSNLLCNIKSLKDTVIDMIEKLTIDGMKFSPLEYKLVLDRYVECDTPCNLNFIMFITEKILNDELPEFYHYYTEKEIALLYINSIEEELDEYYELDGYYYQNRKLLLEFLSETNISEDTQQEIKQRLNYIDKEIVNFNIEKAKEMQNSSVPYDYCVYEDILYTCEMYDSENIEVLKLKNYVLELKYKNSYEIIKILENNIQELEDKIEEDDDSDDYYSNDYYSEYRDVIDTLMIEEPELYDLEAIKNDEEYTNLLEDSDNIQLNDKEATYNIMLRRSKLLDKYRKKVTFGTGYRPINIIAYEIIDDWNYDISANVKPYLNAMTQLTCIDDMYGNDSAASIIGYFLTNADDYQTSKSEILKHELENILKSNEECEKNKINTKQGISITDDMLENQDVINIIVDELIKKASESDYPDEMIELLEKYRNKGIQETLKIVRDEYPEEMKDLIAGNLALFKKYINCKDN